MSIRALGWAFEQEIFPATNKFVLVAMANFASDTGSSFPGIETLRHLTGLSDKTITTALRTLEELEFIWDTGKKAGITGKVKVYQLPNDACAIPPKRRVLESSSNPVAIPEESGSNTPLKDNHHIEEPVTGTKTTTFEADFEAFWKAYPRHVNKSKAKAALLKALKKTTLETILKNLANQKKTNQWTKDNGQFIPHPTTWLNGERWEDEIATGPAPRPEGIPSQADVISVCKEKWGEDPRHTNWGASFWRHWTEREWKRRGLLIDWRVELSNQVNQWRKEKSE